MSATPAAAALPPLEQGSLSARVYGVLREALIGGTFGPGQRIIMQDLAGRLGVAGPRA